MERSRRRRRSAAAWHELVERFAGSGLTVTAFCRREAISAASFYRWRALSSRADAVAARSVAVRQHAAAAAAGFVDLGALRPVVSPLELELDLGGNVRLRLVRG
jgi:putative transposase